MSHTFYATRIILTTSGREINFGIDIPISANTTGSRRFFSEGAAYCSVISESEFYGLAVRHPSFGTVRALVF